MNATRIMNCHCCDQQIAINAKLCPSCNWRTPLAVEHDAARLSRDWWIKTACQVFAIPFLLVVVFWILSLIVSIGLMAGV